MLAGAARDRATEERQRTATIQQAHPAGASRAGDARTQAAGSPWEEDARAQAAGPTGAAVYALARADDGYYAQH
eukprot:5802810-Prymnesium_polylepis.1